MCGIIGYIGKRQVIPILLDGLKRLEYRGYDSAGIAIIYQSKILRYRSVGKIIDLERMISSEKEKLNSNIGIGHTRWATHGIPSEENTHPHIDCTNSIAIVHNGIIENFIELKKKLIKKGHKFMSQTDSEVIVHLIEEYMKTYKLEDAIRKACLLLKGSYAIVALEKNTQTLVGVRKSAPLIIGIEENGYFAASDIPAILPQTRNIITLFDNEMCILKKTGYKLVSFDNREIKREIIQVQFDPISIEKKGYKHFMLKEIHEQVSSIEDTLRGRIIENDVILDQLNISEKELIKLNKIFLIGCGTAYHACLIGKYMIESLSCINVEADIASEFRYRDVVIDKNAILVAVSQSGETADTLAAVKRAKENNIKVISICNVLGSTLTREADGFIHTQAGPEIGVASTKAFTSQVVALFLFGLYLAKIRNKLSKKKLINYIKLLLKLPSQIQEILNEEEKIIELAKKYFNYKNFLYLGRGILYPVAMEGALKLKEISYIHAEGYPAGEMKHGPIALIDKDMPAVVICLDNSKVYEKTISNIQEIKARDGIVIAIANKKDKLIRKFVNDIIYIPQTCEELSSILAVIPLQLFAYHIGVLKGYDVDQPRNLAKSVTVE
jgi:glucosamine--fructose-6-phosphate aminotransferase (isomerizing)